MPAPIFSYSPHIYYYSQHNHIYLLPYLPLLCSQIFQVATEIAVYHVGQISLVRFNHLAQFFQRELWVEEYLAHFQIVQYIFIYLTIDSSYFFYSLICEFLLPIKMSCFEKQIFLPFGSKGALVAMQKQIVHCILFLSPHYERNTHIFTLF